MFNNRRIALMIALRALARAMSSSDVAMTPNDAKPRYNFKLGNAERVPGGGQRERERRLRQMAKQESRKCG